MRYSLSVVAPITLIDQRANAGFNIFPISIDPSVFPAPTTVCSSSIKSIICPSDFSTVCKIALSLSSNSQRYLLPAMRDPISNSIIFLFLRESGTSPLMIC